MSGLQESVEGRISDLDLLAMHSRSPPPTSPPPYRPSERGLRPGNSTPRTVTPWILYPDNTPSRPRSPDRRTRNQAAEFSTLDLQPPTTVRTYRDASQDTSEARESQPRDLHRQLSDLNAELRHARAEIEHLTNALKDRDDMVTAMEGWVTVAWRERDDAKHALRMKGLRDSDSELGL